MQARNLNLYVSHVICFNVTLHVGHVLSCVATVTTGINSSIFEAFCVDNFIQLLQNFSLTFKENRFYELEMFHVLLISTNELL